MSILCQSHLSAVEGTVGYAKTDMSLRPDYHSILRMILYNFKVLPL